MSSNSGPLPRHNLDLQKYHQVIALSQSGINDILERNFTCVENEKLIRTISIDLGNMGLKDAKLGAPTVELIDGEDADAGVYNLHLTSGRFFYDEPIGPLELDEYGDTKPRMTTRVKLPTAGWKIGFHVSFKAEDLVKETIPESIRNKLNTAGSYGVKKLTVAFSSAATTSFLFKESETPGWTPTEFGIRTLGTVLMAHITRIVDQPGLADANLLGYAVEVKGVSGTDPNRPHFLPTSVRNQIVGYREDKNSKPDKKHAKNAFLFTEMTDNAAMPDGQMKWSDNWFTGDLAGTLAMSKGLFTGYLLPKLQPCNLTTLTIANAVINSVGAPKFVKAGWLIEKGGVEPAVSTLTWNNVSGGHTWRWDKDIEYTEEGTESDTFDYKVDWHVKGWIFNEVELIRGEGKVTITSKFRLLNRRILCPQNTLFREVARYTLDAVVFVKYTTTLDLKAVDDTGALVVDVNTVINDLQVKNDGEAVTAFDDIPKLKDLVKRKVDDLEKGLKESESLVRAKVEKLCDMSQLKKSLEGALNNQTKLIFPGGGTFAMKDPVFSAVGDLLIGLTYKTANT